MPNLSRPASMKPPKVLIIEDSTEVAEMLDEALRREGMEVWMAQDAEKGLELARQHEFDLALIDQILPGMDGLEACGLFRSDPRLARVPVIMMTGRQSTDDKVKAFELGAVDYVNKPFVIPELLARMGATLRRKASLDRWVLANREEREQDQDELRRLGSAVDHAADAIVIVDGHARILYANHSFSSLFGANNPREHRSTWVDSWLGQPEIWASIRATCQHGQTWSGEVSVKSVNGGKLSCLCRASPLPSPGELVLLFTDISERKRLETELLRLANHDALTGLSNRRYFSDQLAMFLESEEESAYLFYLDFDHFKAVNAASGFEAGDRMLREAAAIIRGEGKPEDLLARFGGDDFVILVPGIGEAEALARARSLVERFDRHRFIDGGRAYPSTASVGVSRVQRSNTAEDNLSDVASACFVAKERGRNGFALFQDDDEALRQLGVESRWSLAVKDALHSDRMEIWLQPILPVHEAITRVYFEVLLRMRDERGNRILPGEFMPAAQRFGNMMQIDRFVIRKSIQLLQSHPTLQLAINLSAQSLGDPALPDFLEECFLASHVEPSRASFEITETAAIQNIEHTRRLIDRIKKRGSRFALDDFGSGFSSMTYLRDLPVDYVKIDGSFIKKLGQDPVSRSLVRAMNETAHILGKQTVAEFVTDAEVFRHVVELGLDFAQGWHICEPAPPEKFLKEGLDRIARDESPNTAALG